MIYIAQSMTCQADGKSNCTTKHPALNVRLSRKGQKEFLLEFRQIRKVQKYNTIIIKITREKKSLYFVR